MSRDTQDPIAATISARNGTLNQARFVDLTLFICLERLYKQPGTTPEDIKHCYRVSGVGCSLLIRAPCQSIGGLVDLSTW